MKIAGNTVIPGKIRMLTLVMSGLLASTVAQAGPSPYATTVIINGKVITADSDDIKAITIAEAIAIQG